MSRDASQTHPSSRLESTRTIAALRQGGAVSGDLGGSNGVRNYARVSPYPVRQKTPSEGLGHEQFRGRSEAA